MKRDKALILALLRLAEEAEDKVILPSPSPLLAHTAKLLSDNKFIRGFAHPGEVEITGITWAGYDLLEELSGIPGIVAVANDLKGKIH